MGDFNTIMQNDEKTGGPDKEEWKLRDFRDFVGTNQLIDIGFVGYPFTWSNKRGGEDNIRLRLDRALANSKWRSYYPEIVLKHLHPRGSDHCPIILA